jgi:alpha-beta hydrolase superfamily lysophospholipase
MKDFSQMEYGTLDKPEILSLLFHPRREESDSRPEGEVHDVRIPVEDNVTLGARFHHAAKTAPTILFFHGNGEIVSDYDEIGPLYVRKNVNFFPVDYRGYGRSTGNPTVTSMMRDCHAVFEYVKTWLDEREYTGPLVVMGRSLGSAPALELASHYRELINGIIIESGFAYLLPLLSLIGVSLRDKDITEEEGTQNLEKIRTVDIPTLIIHAQYDRIIPFTDGRALYEASGAEDKRILMIPRADHNTVFVRGYHAYLAAITDFLRLLME